MANVMLKSVATLKLAKILKGRLTLNSVKLCREQYFIRSYTNTRHTKTYATAAYKVLPSEDSDMKNDTRSNDIKDVDSLDAALSKIDSVIRRTGRTQLKNINEIFSALTNKEITTSTHGLYLLRSCKYCFDEPSSKRINLVNQIWNRYQELGIEFDVRHYNALLDAHVSSGLDFNPAEILASMEDLNIEPNKATYMLIIKNYCQNGNIAGASEILGHMKEKGLAIDENVFNYLIEGHIKNNDIAGAKEMIEVMRSSNLEPSADTYSIIACGYAAIGNKEEMMNHLKECKEINSATCYLKVIEVLASSGNHQYIDIDEVLSLIQNKEYYTQEFINCAVELIHKNCIDVAYKLAVATCTPTFNEGINIFVKQLLKVRKEPSEVIHFCERIRNENLNENILILTSRVAAEYGLFDYIVPIVKKQQELGYSVRPSLFWPLFTVAKESSPEGPWLILKKMSECGVPCDFKTYIDVFYPLLGVPSPGDVLHEVKKSGQAKELAADALFIYYCKIGEIDHANHLTQLFPVKVSGRLDFPELVTLDQEITTEKAPSYFKLLKFIFADKNNFVENSDVQGKLLAEIIIRKTRLIEILINRFQDLTFSEHTLNVCEQELMKRNPSRQMFVKRLRIVSAERESIFQQENISPEDEDKYIKHLQAQNVSCRPFLTKRITYHINKKNPSRVHELLSVFDELKLEHSPLLLTNLVGMWCMLADLEKAQATFDKIKSGFPDFKLDLEKSLDFVTLLIKYEKFDDSYEVLKNILNEEYMISNKDRFVRSLRKFNLVLSDTQNIEYAKKMQDLISPLSKDIGLKDVLVDPIVNLHLQRNNLAAAFEEFRNLIMNYRVPVSLSTFLKRCINSDEKDILQKVIDLTINCSGKSYALLELAVALIETKNVNKARRVIESLGQETDPKILDEICARLSRQNKLNELEILIFVTKSLGHVDREKLYCHAFRACAAKNNFQRAIELFEKLKEEVVEPEPQTLKVVKDLLEKNNQTIPLSLLPRDQQEKEALISGATKTFIEFLKAGNVEEALKELNGLKKGYIRTLSMETLTNLVDLCLQNNRVHDLSSNVQAMSYIIENVKDVFMPILEKYSKAGDVEKFNSITSFMPDFSLMGISFNTYFGKAFIYSGQYENFLSQLEERVDKKNKLFSGLAFEELLKIPELEGRVFNLAVKYMDFNFRQPMSVLWAHYFVKENYEKADEIHKNFQIYVDKVDNFIFKHIKENDNVALARKYIDFINVANVRPRLKERAYGCAIDLLVSKGMYDEAASLVTESEGHNLQLYKYYLSTLVTLKSCLEKENKIVPFSIPVDMSSGSGSDSD